MLLLSTATNFIKLRQVPLLTRVQKAVQSVVLMMTQLGMRRRDHCIQQLDARMSLAEGSTADLNAIHPSEALGRAPGAKSLVSFREHSCAESIRGNSLGVGGVTCMLPLSPSCAARSKHIPKWLRHNVRLL
jgi:hypothetical protein